MPRKPYSDGEPKARRAAGLGVGGREPLEFSTTGAQRAGTGLIARDREVSHLERILWGARRQQAGVAIVRGEPGVGKSTLIESAIARASDFSVFQVRGTVSEGDPGVSEWPEPIAELLRRHSPVDPDATSRPGTFVNADGRKEAARYAADALRQLAHAASAPLFVSVTECQLLPAWASMSLIDAMTLHLTNESIALVLSFCDPPNVTPVNLPGSMIAAHRLTGLNLDQSCQLIRSRFSVEPNVGVLRSLVEATCGNPHALVDVYGNLSPDEQGGFRQLPEPIPVSAQVAHPFGAAIEDLSLDARIALATTAAGRTSVEILEATLAELGLTIEALATPQATGIVTIRGERLDFVHPMVGVAAYRRLAQETRGEVHRALSCTFLNFGLVERAALHAGQCAQGPVQSVARLYGEAARIAMDRGDARAAARHNEMVAEFAEAGEVAARHLAHAAEFWVNLGESARALVCVERALESNPIEQVQGEALYQRARARAGAGSSIGEVVGEIERAASLCTASSPSRSVVMLCDAAARALLENSSGDPIDMASRAMVLSKGTTSHVEAIAQATLAAARELADSEHDDSILSSCSVLIGQTQRFPASPESAYVIGLGLIKRGELGHARRWAQWIEQCAHSSGDRMLLTAAPLLEAVVCLQWGSLEEAIEDATVALNHARSVGNRVLSGRALGVLVEAHSARGSYSEGLEHASQLFSVADTAGQTSRAQAFVGLALLELQRDRPTSALSWLSALDEDLLGAGNERSTVPNAVMAAEWAPALAVALLLCHRPSETSALLEFIEALPWDGGSHSPWRRWTRAISTSETDVAEECFRLAAESLKSTPLVQGEVWLCWGSVLAGVGRIVEARRLLEEARIRFTSVEAHGWVRLAERELVHMPIAGHDPAARDAGTTEFHSRPPSRSSRVAAESLWEIKMLGSFAIRSEGKKVTLPLSLSAQTLKIVALRESISVDELVEFLWPDAEPGVGNRRLRNVLWRIRSTCGELLIREDNLICLAPETITDVTTFKRQAERALDPGVPLERALVLAHDALRTYSGELLPGDRFADWAEGPRELLRRLNVRLLDMLIEGAVEDNQLQEALSLVDRLIEEDPYEEGHYLRAAEIHSRAGNHRSATSMVERAERMLSDLGVPPSTSFYEMRRLLGVG